MLESAEVAFHGETLAHPIEGFEHRGFPQCRGEIDGNHIQISATKSFYTDYHNRKGWYSVILQGLVDSDF